MNKEEKAKLWSERIQEFQTSGQTCKQWCAEKGIPLSTMGYWTRRLAKEDSSSEVEQELVFARLPSEQEAARKLLSEEIPPVRIFISDSIRIEISDSCRPELMKSILGVPAVSCLTWQEERRYILPVGYPQLFITTITECGCLIIILLTEHWLFATLKSHIWESSKAVRSI